MEQPREVGRRERERGNVGENRSEQGGMGQGRGSAT